MNTFPVLYIEDEESDVRLLQHVFAKVGILNPLHAVTDGKAAVDYLAGHPPYADRDLHPLPGLVLIDLNLPYWSGLEVLAWLRQQEHLRGVPAIMLSSSSRPDDIARAYDAGANAYLVKPGSLDELTTLVEALRDFWLVLNRVPSAVETRAPRRAIAAPVAGLPHLDHGTVPGLRHAPGP